MSRGVLSKSGTVASVNQRRGRSLAMLAIGVRSASMAFGYRSETPVPLVNLFVSFKWTCAFADRFGGIPASEIVGEPVVVGQNNSLAVTWAALFLFCRRMCIGG